MVANIDSDAYPLAKAANGVSGYPTLIYFSYGKALKYNGKREKQPMMSWMLRKTRPPVLELESYASL